MFNHPSRMFVYGRECSEREAKDLEMEKKIGISISL